MYISLLLWKSSSKIYLAKSKKIYIYKIQRSFINATGRNSKFLDEEEEHEIHSPKMDVPFFRALGINCPIFDSFFPGGERA